MECSISMNVKMETKAMATKALEVMKKVLAQADGFEYDCRETIDRFAATLMVKGSEIVSTGGWGLLRETNLVVLPEMFKAVARCFCSEKFSAKLFYDSTYEWESFDISYEDGKLIIKSLYHNSDDEPHCDECDDYYEYFEEDGVEGYRCCGCGHIISVEEFNAACKQHFENVYTIL